MNRIDTYRVETAGTLDDCLICGTLAAAREAAERRALATGRLQLVWDRGAAMYVHRVYPSRMLGGAQNGVTVYAVGAR